MTKLQQSFLFYATFMQVAVYFIIPRLRNILVDGIMTVSEQLSNTNVSEESSTFIIKDGHSTGEHIHDQRNIFMKTDDFKTLRLHGKVFVDKSEMISEYLDRGGLVLIVTRPRKWGKSVNINMFKYFFEIEVNKDGTPLSEKEKINSFLFTGGNMKLDCGTIKNLEPLKIASSESAMIYQGYNPVILISLKDIKGNSYQEIKNTIAAKVRHLYTLYPYLNQYISNESLPLLETDQLGGEKESLTEKHLEKSLYFLSKLLFLHFKRNAYVFVDDYDAPITNAYLTFGCQSEEFFKVTDLTYRIIGKVLKDNQYLERGLLTGTFHYGWLNEILKFHNVRHSSIVCMTFSRFYGFTKKEVEKIIEDMPTRNSLPKLKEWYNGYDFDGQMIFNPWSTLSHLSGGGEFDYYWGDIIDTTSELVDRVYMLDNVQEYLHGLLQDKIISRKDVNKPITLADIEKTFYRVLLFAGFFNPKSSSGEPNCYTHPWNLSIPNREVKGVMARGVSKWVANKLGISAANYLHLMNLLVNLKVDNFREKLQQYLLNSTLPKHPSEKQHIYHQLLSGMLSSLAARYTIESFRKPGQRSREYRLISFSDLGDDEIIIEYEVCKTPKKLISAVEAGLKKLISRQYKDKEHFKHIKLITKIYMAFYRKKVSLKYQVSEIG